MYPSKSNYHNMDVKISKISEDENELVDIRCHEETDHVREIADFVRSRQGQLNGMLEGRQYALQFNRLFRT